MTLQLARPTADIAAKCGRVAVLMGGDSAGRTSGLEMPDLVLSILTATLTGGETHVQVP